MVWQADETSRKRESPNQAFPLALDSLMVTS